MPLNEWGLQVGLEPAQRGRPPAAPAPDQYSLGSKIVLLVKYSAISGSGKSAYSIALLKTALPFPSSQVSVAVWSSFSFHSWNSSPATLLAPRCREARGAGRGEAGPA